MARSDKRYMVYPAPKAVQVVGDSAPSLNQAIECWAALLVRAMADNAESFWPSYCNPDTGDEHCLHDWAFLATVLRNLYFDPDFANPAELLATAVEDAHRLEKVGRQWFFTDGDIHWKEIDVAVQKLAKKFRQEEFDYPHAWALIVAVQWFWEHVDEGIDIKNDEWWTLAFRRQWKPKENRKATRVREKE